MPSSPGYVSAQIIRELIALEGRAKVTFQTDDLSHCIVERVQKVLLRDSAGNDFAWQLPYGTVDEEYNVDNNPTLAEDARLVEQHIAGSDDIYVQVYRRWETIDGLLLTTAELRKWGAFTVTTKRKVTPDTLPNGASVTTLSDRVEQTSAVAAEETKEFIGSLTVSGGGFTAAQLSGDVIVTTAEKDKETGVTIFTDHFIAPKTYQLPVTYTPLALDIITVSSPLFSGSNLLNIGGPINQSLYGWGVSASGVPSGTTVLAQNGAAITMTANATGNVILAAVSFIPPVYNVYPDWKQPNMGAASVIITAGGSGYTNPTVNFTGGNGFGATGAAVILGGVIVGVTINAAGTGYTNGTVTFSGDAGTGAAGIFLASQVGQSGYSSNSYSPPMFPIDASREDVEKSESMVVKIRYCRIPAAMERVVPWPGRFPAIFENNPNISINEYYQGLFKPPWPIGAKYPEGYSLLLHRQNAWPAKEIMTYSLGEQKALPPIYRVYTPGVASKIFHIPDECIHNGFAFSETVTTVENGTSTTTTYEVENLPSSTPSNYDSRSIIVVDAKEERWMGDIWRQTITLASEQTPISAFPSPVASGYYTATRYFSATSPVPVNPAALNRQCFAQVTSGAIANSVMVTAGGTGYTTQPTITGQGANASGASFTATISGTAIASIAVNAGGDGYVAGALTITGGGGTGATVTYSITTNATPNVTLIGSDAPNHGATIVDTVPADGATFTADAYFKIREVLLDGFIKDTTTIYAGYTAQYANLVFSGLPNVGDTISITQASGNGITAITLQNNGILTPIGTASSGSSTITVSSASGLMVGMTIIDTTNSEALTIGGAGSDVWTTITAISGTAVTLSTPTLSAIPGATTTASFSSGSNTITVGSATGITDGMTVVGAGIPSGATVTDISAAPILTISANTTATGSSEAVNFGDALAIAFFYTNGAYPPLVSIVGVGIGAAAIAGLSLAPQSNTGQIGTLYTVGAVTVTNQGSGYASLPVVTVYGGSAISGAPAATAASGPVSVLYTFGFQGAMSVVPGIGTAVYVGIPGTAGYNGTGPLTPWIAQQARMTVDGVMLTGVLGIDYADGNPVNPLIRATVNNGNLKQVDFFGLDLTDAGTGSTALTLAVSGSGPSGLAVLAKNVASVSGTPTGSLGTDGAFGPLNLSAPNLAGGITAQVSGTVSGYISAVGVTSGGYGYTNGAAVSFSGGGTGATATIVASSGGINGAGSGSISAFNIAGISVTNQGSGYTPSAVVGGVTKPSVGVFVTIATNGSGSGAAAGALVNVSGNIIASVTPTGTAASSGATTISVSSTSGIVAGMGISDTTTLTNLSIGTTITSVGAGNVVISAPALAGFTSHNLLVSGFVVTAGGSSYSGTITATAHTGVIQSVALTAGGSGYSGAGATVSGGTGGTLSVTNPHGVTALSVTTAGTGYTTAPAIDLSSVVTGGVATAALSSTSQVFSFTLVNPGTNTYGSAPTVAFTGGGGSGAAATVNLTGGLPSSVTVTNEGTGYTSAPAVTISGTPTGTTWGTISQFVPGQLGPVVASLPGAIAAGSNVGDCIAFISTSGSQIASFDNPDLIDGAPDAEVKAVANCPAAEVFYTDWMQFPSGVALNLRFAVGGFPLVRVSYQMNTATGQPAAIQTVTVSSGYGSVFTVGSTAITGTPLWTSGAGYVGCAIFVGGSAPIADHHENEIVSATQLLRPYRGGSSGFAQGFVITELPAVLLQNAGNADQYNFNLGTPTGPNLIRLKLQPVWGSGAVTPPSLLWRQVHAQLQWIVFPQ